MPVLQFKGKSAIESYHHVVAHHRLEFDKKLSVLGKGEKPGLDGNLIIEGDNLLALKALLPTHAGRVKCIYIDPPYNTGNEGWVYKDNLTQPQFKEWIGRTVGKEAEDACRHDKWCCMMYPRLQLLKELLCNDGAIFISIDDNELTNLRMLMDEIFGPENFVGLLIWRKKEGGGQTDAFFVTEHEYVVVYARDKEEFHWLDERIIRPEDEFPEEDKHGRFKSVRLAKWGSSARKIDRPTMHFPIESPDGKKVLPIAPDGSEGRWRVGRVTMDEIIAEGRLHWKKEHPDWTAYEKVYLTDANAVKVLKARSILFDLASSGDGANELTEIFGRKDIFENAKPVELIKFLILRSCNSDALVLDSFAGSGTTAHAVLELNKEDGGKRQFILVQIPHETKEQQRLNFNIARKITSERVRRVLQGYTYSQQRTTKKKVEGLGGSFTFAMVGEPLFGEYRDLGKKLPAFEELAKYIFYTETSRQCDLKKINPDSGFIGSTEAAGGTSYYLLYTPNHKEDREMSLETLKALLKKDKNHNWVVYCEKVWLHQDQLRKFEQEHGKRIRPMIVPFNLK